MLHCEHSHFHITRLQPAADTVTLPVEYGRASGKFTPGDGDAAGLVAEPGRSPLIYFPKNSEGLTEHQTPPRKHAGLAIANAEARDRYTVNHPARRHAQHQAELVLECSRADAGCRPRGRVEVDVCDCIGCGLEGVRAPAPLERSAQLDAVAQPGERLA